MTTKEIKNENLDVTLSIEPGCRVVFDIKVSPKATQAARKKAIKVVNKEVSLPGFRKGKAPEAIITQNYGKHVDQEWKDIILQTAFQESLALTDMYPLNKESVEKAKVNNLSLEEGAEIHFEMETFPEIPEIAASDLNLEPVAPKEVTEKDVEDSFENIRYQHADWSDVEGRPVEENDFVELDVINLDDPSQPYLCRDMRFEVKKGKIGEWMKKLVIGKNVGDSVEGTSEKDETTTDEDLFRPTRCKVTVKAIKSVELPELNEEFAQKFRCESIDELKKRIEEELIERSKEDAQEETRNQITKIILEKYPFEIPQSMIEDEKASKRAKFEQLKEKLSEEQIATVAPYYAEEKMTEDTLNNLRLLFIVRHLADANKIQVMQEEFMKELTREMQSPSGFIDPNMEPEQMQNKLYLRIVERKVKDLLIEQAKAA